MKNKSLSVLALALAATLTACGPAVVGNYFAPTAAVVNGSKVPESKIAQELKQTLANPETSKTFVGAQGAQRRLEAQREILTRLVKQEVIVQEARSKRISVKDSEIEAELKKLDQQFGGRSGLIKEAEKQGFTLPQVRVFFRERLLIEKVADQVTKGVKPSEESLRQTYEANKASFEEVKTAHILICGNFSAEQRSCTHTPEDEKLASRVAERARAGEDFAALAKEFSKDDSNKDTGGELPFFGRNSGFAPEFVDGAFPLQVGQISAPVRTPFGFHVIKMLERKTKTFEEAKPELEQSSNQEVQQAFQKWLEEEVRKAEIVINPKFGRFDETSQRIVPKRLEVDSTVPGAPAGRQQVEQPPAQQQP